MLAKMYMVYRTCLSYWLTLNWYSHRVQLRFRKPWNTLALNCVYKSILCTKVLALSTFIPTCLCFAGRMYKESQGIYLSIQYYCMHG